ncbi:hypothetical protein EB796_015640 [Bugula neritina]|uniref:Uncharacterized protein n=1 Tax=Bugula neritina TaxID=10212 RepID=A0A7J7JIE4_BUGNE|nr:hypothetical protein EB796_015640 [Bugula neritina]
MAGEEVQDIFEVLPAGEGANEYARAMAALDTHFTPRRSFPMKGQGAKGQINSMDNSAKKYTADTGNDIEALFTVSDNTGGEMFNINAARSAKLSVQVNNTNLSVLIDSGASSNLLDRNTAKLVGCVVKPTTKQLFAYGNKSACLDLIGETDVNVFVPSTGKCVHAKFYIFNGTATTLLCKSTSEQLGVLRVGPVSEGVHFASSDLASGDGQSWLVTDHKPLEFIFNRVNSKPSARIERWVLRLQAFDYEVVYKPGSMNIADPLSRLSVDEQTTYNVNNVADEYVMMIAKLSVPKAMSFNEIKNAAAKCLEMGQVRKSLINGLWSNCLPAYKAVMTELAEVEGVVMRGNRIVMPVSLRSVAVELAHEGHQGTSCYECQLVSALSRPPPMSSTKMPDKPWEHIACDLLVHYPMERVFS